jgi:hypothetical protein
MFGIKLVGALHYAFPFFGRDGKPPLMNFPDSPEGRRVAAEVPIGHRSLVYLMHPVKRFKAAIEYVKWDSNIDDVLEEGSRAAATQNAVAMLEVFNSRFARIWRCVRVVALIDDPMQGPATDFGFQEGDIMLGISQQEYLEWFNALPWNWTAEGN